MNRNEDSISIKKWLTSEEILFYIIDSYAGTELPRSGRGRSRRVFLWEEDGVLKMGNTEAFLEHVSRRFHRHLKSHYASAIHQTLRELGEATVSHTTHETPRADSPRRGQFTQPAPDAWVVSRPNYN